jgi:hypothetical protein
VLNVNHNITMRSPYAPLLLVEQVRPPLIVLHHGNRLVHEVVPDAPTNCHDSCYRTAAGCYFLCEEGRSEHTCWLQESYQVLLKRDTTGAKSSMLPSETTR